jgi:hypothetical protein
VRAQARPAWVTFYLRWLKVGFRSVWGIVGVIGFFASIILGFYQDRHPELEKTMSHLVWLIPVCIFAFLAFIGLVIAPYKLHKDDLKKSEDEKESLIRQKNEVTAQLDTEKKKTAQKKPRLYLRYEHPDMEAATFSGLVVGNYGEPAYEVRLTSNRNHGCGLIFFEGTTTLGTGTESRVNLNGVFWAGREERFQTTPGKQLPALFDKLEQLGAEEKIFVTLHCEDHDHTPFDEQWLISRGLFKQISCGRLSTPG